MNFLNSLALAGVTKREFWYLCGSASDQYLDFALRRNHLRNWIRAARNPQLTSCFLLSRCLKAHLNFKPFLKQGCVHYPINHSRLLSALSLWCSVSGCPPRDLPPRWDTVPFTVPLKSELLSTPSMFFMVTILKFYIMTLQAVNRGRILRGCRFARTTGTFW